MHYLPGMSEDGDCESCGARAAEAADCIWAALFSNKAKPSRSVFAVTLPHLKTSNGVEQGPADDRRWIE
jgi:hypothetical protein